MVKKSSKLANEPKTDPETAPTHLLPVTGGKAAYTTIKHREKSAYEEFVGPWTAMALSAVYEIACNDDLTTVREIKVYLYIISKIQNGNFAEVAQKHIAADTKIAATHVSTAIKSLISRGMISRHETNKQKYFINFAYAYRGAHTKKNLNAILCSPEYSDMKSKAEKKRRGLRFGLTVHDGGKKDG